MTTIDKSKTNALELSRQVENILHSYGLSRVFNTGDFRYFRERTRGNFNQAQEIAELFIQENRDLSDFNNYQF